MRVLKTLFFLLLNFNLYSYDLPTVLVEADKIIPYDSISKIEGEYLLDNYENNLRCNTILLAAYIHTQSIGNKDMNSLGDKYAIAQVIVTRLKYKYRKCKTLQEYLPKCSTTIKKGKSRYFWIDPKEYYSQQCLIAAYNVLQGKIPIEFYVGKCSRFQNNKKCKPLSSKTHNQIKVFTHTFYESKRFLKRINKNG